MIALPIGLTVYGMLSIAGCLLLAIHAERIRARLLRNSSGGVATLIRMFALAGVVVGAAFVLIGVGNLIGHA